MKRKHIIAFYIAFIIFGIGLYKLANQSKLIVKYYEEYTVQANDTLWQIASQYPHKSIEELIYIIEDNNNTTANLQIGQTLIIPILEVD